ncbi:200 kDa antigen p200 [Trypanosoma conorhini]|uniref:200 kDa antigen p200 n=1 Tax=Trypanosoma conorhini TaxID=83891 RepID=A0A3R7PM01_9TRYP|nr:200 kDa antigen p200 [Trypanosoma conorhini]RNF27357.1 200 kDa antigen p200 [Trypanosoma conorhini]
MESDHVAGIGVATRDDPDVSWNPYFSYRAGSCGSATSFGELRGSQGSIRHGSRLSCRSSVRDDAHTLDESRRKQRVIRYMQEERERAARSKLERLEHDDWMSFRALERCERMQYMDDEERAEFLRQEALEAERERVAAEEAARRAAEAALNRRCSAANARPRVESREASVGPRGGKEALVSVTQKPDAAAARASPAEGVESPQKTMAVAQKLEMELRSQLRRAQDDASDAQAEIEKTRQMHRTVEESLLREVKRANDEAAMRKVAEERAASLEKGINDMRRRVAEMAEELRRLRGEAEEEQVRLGEKEEQLRSLREQLSAAQKENAALEATCKQLRAEKDALPTRARNALPPKPAEGQRKQPQRKSIRANNLGDAVAKTEPKSSQQPLQAATNPSRDNQDEVHSLRGQLEQQATALKQVRDENAALKDHLQEETRMRRTFEDLATQAHRAQNDGSPIEKLRQAEEEAKRYKAEAGAARQERDELRATADKEIAFLKDWCARLDAQCRQQMRELREQQPHDATRAPRTEDRAEHLSSARAPRDAAETTSAGDSALVEKLQAELNETRALLKESEEQKQRALATTASLKPKQGTSPKIDGHISSGAPNQIGVLPKANKEPREAEAAGASARGEPAAEWNKEEPLQRANGLPPQAVGPAEARLLPVHVAKEIGVGAGTASVAPNGFSTELEELREQLASLQQELEKERQARVDAEREAAAQKARADKEAAASMGKKKKTKDKAKCHC